jgi:hypothetical protein
MVFRKKVLDKIFQPSLPNPPEKEQDLIYL